MGRHRKLIQGKREVMKVKTLVHWGKSKKIVRQSDNGKTTSAHTE